MPSTDGNLFRSEEMSYIKMYIENDAAHDIVKELGKFAIIEFRDLNPDTTAFQRKFAADVKRCEEMERKSRALYEQMKKLGVRVPEVQNRQVTSLVQLEQELVQREKEMNETNSHYDDLQRSLEDRIERKMVLTNSADIYDSAPRIASPSTTGVSSEMTDSLMEFQRNAGSDVTPVSHICGSILTDKVGTFEKIVFRATRGNCYSQFRTIAEPVPNPVTGVDEYKSVFMTFYNGQLVGQRISKIAEALNASVYDFPLVPSERDALLEEVSKEVDEFRSVLQRTGEERMALLESMASSIHHYNEFISSEKAIYHTMNLFDGELGRKGMVAEGWCPTRYIEVLKKAVDVVGSRPNMPRTILNTVRYTSQEPPTFFLTNKLTSGFQAIVDAYGIADYQEFNPMPFTVITFPFLFAVMFGDLGHGFIMFLFALFMLAKERYFLQNPPGEIFAICFGGRYVILLMSIFSMYTGLLYNDTFGMSFDFFGTGYKANCDHFVNDECERYHFDNYNLINSGPDGPCPSGTPCLPVYRPGSDVYPFGLDPVWKMSENELSYTNSLKMKMSIVFGVTQMEFGVLLSGLNHIYFGKWISFFHEFIPQVLFLSSIFGYMTLVIFVKWNTQYTNTHCAPSILSTFIDMFLGFGKVSYEPACKSGAYFVPNQEALEQGLILVAFVSVPWMLFTKPLLEDMKHKRLARVHTQEGDDPEEPLMKSDEGHQDGGHGEHDFTEEMVHQIIHTIEFVLGAVSNTASYLRLWALSLAHAQLSTVFWEKVMVDQIKSGSGAAIVCSLFVWVLCTAGVLMVMESLSAFLHALRLHWVEFQNKFYHGQGRKFLPFSFPKATLL